MGDLGLVIEFGVTHSKELIQAKGHEYGKMADVEAAAAELNSSTTKSLFLGNALTIPDTLFLTLPQS